MGGLWEETEKSLLVVTVTFPACTGLPAPEQGREEEEEERMVWEWRGRAQGMELQGLQNAPDTRCHSIPTLKIAEQALGHQRTVESWEHCHLLARPVC